jgi:LPXTG-motif cell wall-anchored protein
LRRRLAILATTLGVAALVVAYPVAAMAQSRSFTLVKTIALPGTGGHGDWVDFDPSNGLVYVALHQSGVAVVDPAAGKVVADVEPVAGPNGIAHDGQYVYAAAGDSNELVVISKSDWKIVNRVKTKGTTPDGVWVDAGHGTLLVASDDNNWIEVYNGGAYPKLITTWPLQPSSPKSGPDVGVLVPDKNALYQPDDALVERLDLGSGKVLASVDTGVPLTKLGGTKNMVYDPATNRLWVGTTAKKVLVLNPDDLKVVGSAPAHGGIDQMAFDPGLRLIYAFEGSANGFDAYDADTLKPVAYVNTGSGNTHTGTVDPATHRVFAYEGDANLLAVYTPVSLPKTGAAGDATLLGAALMAAGLLVALRRPRAQS